MLRRITMLICGVATVVIFILMMFPPYGSLSIEKHAGGYVMPDLVMGYNSEYVYAMINAADAQAYAFIKNFYRMNYLLLVFAVTAMVLTSTIPCKRIEGKAKNIFFIIDIFSTVIFAITGILENVNLEYVFNQYPLVLTGIISAASICTIIKWVFFMVWLLSMVISLAIAIRTRIMRLKKES